MIDGRAQRAALEVELIKRRGFAEFVRRAWHVVEPSQRLIWNWHIDEMCTHAEICIPNFRQPPTPEQAKAGQPGDWALPGFTDFVVNIPPGHMKTVIWCILWPAYVWTYRPEYRWIFATYDPALAYSTAERSYDLITSRWYTERWGNPIKSAGRPAMGDFWTKAGGRRVSTTVGGKATGFHADAFIVDDPTKAAAGESIGSELSALLDDANKWHANTVASRALNPGSFVTGVIMQRIHENDLSQQRLDGGALHLCFPVKFDPEVVCKTPWGGDRRGYSGELLFPERFPAHAVEKTAKNMLGWEGPVACAQLQQAPAPKGGLIFRVDNFRRFDVSSVPMHRTISALSIDCNFKKADVNSDVGISMGGMLAAKMYVYEARSCNIGFNETVELAHALVKEHRPTAVIVEDKALGPALIEIMRKKLPNIIPIQPLDSKEARAHGANTYYQAHSVYHSNQMVGFAVRPTDPAGGVAGFEKALNTFPRGRKKDVIDAHTQLIWYLAQQDLSELLAALDSLDREAPMVRNAFDGMFKIGA